MENRLVATTSATSGLAYDPLGRLSDYTLIPTNPTQFLYDGDALVGEYTAAAIRDAHSGMCMVSRG